MIRNLLLSGVALAAISGSALAADLPLRSAPPVFTPPPLLTWAGFYAGGNVGFAYNQLTVNDRDYSDGLGDNTTKTYDIIGGGQIGYNWQHGALVYGLEVDMDALGNHKTDNNDLNSEIGLPYAQIKSKIDALGTVRGRIGLALDPALIYVTAGFAEGHTNDQYNDLVRTYFGDYNSAPPLWQTNSWKPGFVVGMGVEYMFAPNWSFKAEGLYYNLAEKTVQINESSFGEGSNYYFPRQSFSNQGAIIRVGVNYHFNWMAPAPIVAKY